MRRDHNGHFWPCLARRPSGCGIGIGRVPAFLDFRGQTDPYGHRLRVTLLAAADALSAAAGLAMGKTAGTPAALIRGFDWEATDDTSAAAMLRPAERDLFL